METERQRRIKQLASHMRKRRLAPEVARSVSSCLGIAIRAEDFLHSADTSADEIMYRRLFAIDIDSETTDRIEWSGSCRDSCTELLSSFASQMSRDAFLLTDAGRLRVDAGVVIDHALDLLDLFGGVVLLDVSSVNGLDLSDEEEGLVLTVVGDDWRGALYAAG